MNYECHITFSRDVADKIESLKFKGWKFSKIDGDPLLGKKVFCYLTTHRKTFDEINDAMNLVIINTRSIGLNPIRAKIEHIIFDERY